MTNVLLKSPSAKAIGFVKIGLAASVVALGLSGNVQAAGIPVIDATAIAKHVQTIAELGKQLEEAKNILDQAKQMNQAFDFSELEKLKTMLEDKNFQQYLPQEFGKVAGAVDGLLKENADGFAKQYDYYESKGQVSANDFYNNELKRQKKETYGDMAVGEAVYNQASERLQGLNQLRDKITSTSSPREVMELQARIQAESAILQNEVLRMQGVAMIQEARSRVDDQRSTEEKQRMHDGIAALVGGN